MKYVVMVQTIDLNEEIKKKYPIQDSTWSSRRWKMDRSSYEDMSGGTAEKLVVCSRDIQVGDKILAYQEIGDEPGFPNSLEAGICTEVTGNYITYTGGWQPEIYLERKWCFKIIGDVSPASTVWVKAGDEFEEGDVSWGDKQFDWNLPTIVSFKCPHCKIFN